MLGKRLMVRNFLFHRVSPQRDLLWDPMSVELFDKCIGYISNKYKVVRFEDLIDSDKLLVENKIATIMFDDGYKDNIEYALPILNKYNCKASFYVVTDCIDKNKPTWTHQLEYLFQHTNISDINIDFDFIPENMRVSSLHDTKARLKYVLQLNPILKKLPYHQLEKVVERVNNTYNDIHLPKLMMNWDDLRELSKQGHYIGSHSALHSTFGYASGDDFIMKELKVSGNRIMEELGYFPKTISYPVGSYNSQTKKLVKQAGYKAGLAVKQSIFNPQTTDLFEVDRIELYNESWWKTKMRISNSLEIIKKLIKYR